MEKELIQPVIPTLGKHIIVELSGCEANSINEIASVEKTMVEAATKANATIIKSVFHKFSPVGVSGVVVISESHLSIHTWPELGYAAIDIYTCGNTTKPFKACYYLAQKFKAQKIKATYILRGIENKRKNFYTHKIKIIEGNINVLRVLPTKIKINKYKSEYRNGNGHLNTRFALVGENK
ncbi:MAG: adenosylmethionine decarboxylase [Candidatus Calescibacterium sp.]|nr:adenosylmethionine decarboxylase [Candidatus Calescibacterium sp.]